MLGAEGNASVAERSSGIALVTGTGLQAREATPTASPRSAWPTASTAPVPPPPASCPSHLALLRAGHGAVIHTHAPHATALGLVLDEVPLVMAEQAARAGGRRAGRAVRDARLGRDGPLAGRRRCAARCAPS